jgi:hypothetical protein
LLLYRSETQCSGNPKRVRATTTIALGDGTVMAQWR